MYPIVLDLSHLPVALVGEGDAALKRLRQFDESGAARIRVYAPEPSAELAAQAGDRLVRAWPHAGEVGQAAVVFVAGIERSRAETIAAWARAQGRLVNVEDDLPLCDFHVPALVRRGDLLLSVSTGGKSPGLARRVKEYLAARFSDEWTHITADLAEKRRTWRAEGAANPEVLSRTVAQIEARGLLDTAKEIAV